tara:strand:- start:66 stop:281 length:216 start_codon:yes stop_codon:yes gene_type:complete
MQAVDEQLNFNIDVISDSELAKRYRNEIQSPRSVFAPEILNDPELSSPELSARQRRTLRRKEQRKLNKQKV